MTMTRAGPQTGPESEPAAYDLCDRLILAADRWFMGRRPPGPGRADDGSPAGGSGGRSAPSAPAYPAEGVGPGPSGQRARRRSAGLMRVNHAGEVAAQALYLGQGLLARDPGVRRDLEAAAAEERAHLDWCRRRLSELDARPSRLDPLWRAGSFAIGAAAGAAGDAWSLGFVAETERQVADHLARHLRRLPRDDHRSRAICRRMMDDERRHGTRAVQAGGRRLPPPVRLMMRAAAGVMTTTAYRI